MDAVEQSFVICSYDLQSASTQDVATHELNKYKTVAL